MSHQDLGHPETSSEHPGPGESLSQVDGSVLAGGKGASLTTVSPVKQQWHLTSPSKAHRLLNPKVPGERVKGLIRGPYKKKISLKGLKRKEMVTSPDGQPSKLHVLNQLFQSIDEVMFRLLTSYNKP